ncbi:MAG: Ig-like domain-containing protein, partial [Candidatus Sericytochromatia bacterium]|nr:Ig-like domain-containing protein [Candidatus Sericytochromatia bacterium]
MKIQVQRGNRTIELTAQQAERFAFKAGDQVMVIEGPDLRDVAVEGASGGVRVTLADGTAILLPGLMGLLREGAASLAVGPSVVMLDPSTGRPRAYDLVQSVDVGQPQPEPPADRGGRRQAGDDLFLPDVPSVEDADDALVTPTIGNSARVPAIEQPKAHTAADVDASEQADASLSEQVLGRAPGPLRGALPVPEEASAAAPSPAPNQVPLAPPIRNTNPGQNADFAQLPAAMPATGGTPLVENPLDRLGLSFNLVPTADPEAVVPGPDAPGLVEPPGADTPPVEGPSTVTPPVVPGVVPGPAGPGGSPGGGSSGGGGAGGGGSRGGSSGGGRDEPVPVTQARILKVTSDTPDGTYGEEDLIDIRVEFDQAVTVAGTPLISLNTGSARTWYANMDELEDVLSPTVLNGRAVYAAAKSNPGQGILVFEYEVQAGDFTDRNENKELQLDTTAVVRNLGQFEQLRPVVILPPGAKIDGRTGAANLELPVNGADGKPLETSLAGSKEIKLATPDYPHGDRLPDLVFSAGSDTGRPGEADTLTDRVTRDTEPGMVITNVPAGSELRIFDYVQINGRIERRLVHVEQAPASPPYEGGWVPGAEPGFLTRTLDWSEVSGTPRPEGGVTPVGPLAEGPHHLVAQVRIVDPADATRKINSPRVALPVVIDTTAPPAPGLTLEATSDSAQVGDHLTNATSIWLAGTGEPGALIAVRSGTSDLGSVVVEANGTWRLKVDNLPEGEHTLDATATDRAGNVGQAGSYTFTVDRSLDNPLLPPTITLGTDSGLKGDMTTSVRAPILEGVLRPGEVLDRIEILAGDVKLGQATITAGRWSFTPATALPEGANALQAVAYDKAGNAAEVDFTVTIDTKAPTSTVEMAAISDSGRAATDAITSNNKPLLQGVVSEPFATVTVSAGDVVLGQVVSDAKGAWSLDLLDATKLADPAFPGLPEGESLISVVATDVTGNVAAKADTLKVVIDTDAPAAPGLVGLAAPTDTGRSATDGITSTGKVVLTGTSEPLAIIALTDVVNGDTANPQALVFDPPIVADAEGNWQASVDLVVGQHAITAVATDVAGNQGSTSTTFFIERDITPPGAPTALKLAETSDTGVDEVPTSRTDKVTRITTPTFEGRSEPNATIELYDGDTLIGSDEADEAGFWSVKAGVPLSDGLHAITAKAFDTAGNPSARSTQLTVRIDTVAPTAAIAGLEAATDTGPFKDDSITSLTTPTVTGTTEPGTTVRVFEGNVLLGTTRSDARGNWKFVLPTALEDGTHDLIVVPVDDAGNVGDPSAPRAITIDTSAPDTPSAPVLDPDSDTGD